MLYLQRQVNAAKSEYPDVWVGTGVFQLQSIHFDNVQELDLDFVHEHLFVVH